MFRYSLKDVFYWLTVWVVCVSALRTLLPILVAVFLVTTCLFGTVILNKAVGRWAGLIYAVAIVFVFCSSFIVPVGVSGPPPPSAYTLGTAISVLLSSIGGTAIWLMAVATHAIHKQVVGCNNFGRKTISNPTN